MSSSLVEVSSNTLVNNSFEDIRMADLDRASVLSGEGGAHSLRQSANGITQLPQVGKITKPHPQRESLPKKPIIDEY